MLKYLKMPFMIAESMKELGEVELGRLVKAMISYAWGDEDAKLKGNEKILWNAIKGDIDEQKESHAKRCEVNKTNRNESSRIVTNRNESSRIVNGKEEEEKTEKEKKATKEKSKEEKEVGEKEIAREARTPTRTGGKNIPPTLDEVKAYCKEKNNGVDAEKWYYFYASKGWMVGSNKMKDWHMAVATWARSVKAEQTRKSGEPPSFDLDEFFNAAVERAKKHE